MTSGPYPPEPTPPDPWQDPGASPPPQPGYDPWDRPPPPPPGQYPPQVVYQPGATNPGWQPGPTETQQYPSAYQPNPQPAPRRRHTFAKVASAVGGLLVVLCIAAAIRGVPVLLDRLDEETYPTGAVPSGDSATSTATAAPAGPFADTPAANYAEGEAGITLPAAKAITGFSKAQVVAALQKVKRGLVATRLDNTMLVSRDTSTLIGLLAADARDDTKSNFSNTKPSFFSYATQIAPGYSLTNDKVRVSGRVTFRATKEDDIRQLEVITNFVWVYPFSGSLKESGDHLVIVHDEVHWRFPADADVEQSSRGMWIWEAQGYASNIDCDLLDKHLLALGAPRVVPGGSDEDEDAVFDPNRSLDIENTC